MDTGEPPQEDSVPKPSTGPKGKKKKKEGKKTLTLDQFLATDDGFSEPKSQNWAILSENPDDDYDSNVKFDRSTLPTAPKAAMGPKVDISQIPAGGPFSAYVGNISYDAKESDLDKLFSTLDVAMVRIICDGGRPRGYAYVDFKNRESLVEALSYNDKEYMGRSIRVDLATEKNQEGRGGAGHGGRSNEPDRTEGDWRRREPATVDGDSGRDSDRGGRYGDRSGFDRDRGGGFDKDKGSRGYGDRSYGGDKDHDRGFGERGYGGDRGFGGDRDRDRGSFGGDRERGSFGGDRDRGSFGGDRDRGSFGGDRERGSYGGDRDRGNFGSDRDRGSFGGDRDRGSFGGDRDRGSFGGDRDRGSFGGDRDRGSFGGDRERGSFGGDRERGSFGGDRERGSFGGDRDRGGDRSTRGYGFNKDRDGEGRFGGSRGGNEDRFSGRRDEGRRDDFQRGRRDEVSDRRPISRDGSQEHKDTPKERPHLNLKPRTKPVETKVNEPAARSSIFGSAKPVDTYAREREIEEKLKKKDTEPSSGRRDSDTTHGSRLSGERQNSTGDNRHHSGDRSVQVSRRDSEHSYTSEDGGNKEDSAKSPTASKASEASPKLVPAPPPKENPWVKKKEAGSVSTSSSNTSNISNNATVSSADKKEVALQKPNAWGDPNSRGRGKGGPIKSDGPPGKKIDKQNGSQNGPPRKPDIKGNPQIYAGSETKEAHYEQLGKEKHLPKSIDEMPKYEETKTKDFSDRNKFAYLNEDDDDDQDNEHETEIVS